MKENYPSHFASLTMAHLEKTDKYLIEWLLASSDMNSIEILCSIIKGHVHKNRKQDSSKDFWWTIKLMQVMLKLT